MNNEENVVDFQNPFKKKDKMYNMVPEHTMGALQRYVEKKYQPGSFLTNVLSNNLFEAVACADELNQQHLVDIVVFIYNRLPMDCYGSPDIVQKYLNKK